LNSDGRELRRSLFSLKQIFQVKQKRKKKKINRFFIFFKDDKDLVHEFVNNHGLQCLIKIGGAADQNYQNYILRGRKKIFLLI
jgi:intergrase/recombinase